MSIELSAKELESLFPGIKVIINPNKVPIGSRAITLYPNVYVIGADAYCDRMLLGHEYIHILQVDREVRKHGLFLGRAKWYGSYCWEYVKKGGIKDWITRRPVNRGYENNKYEVEAREKSGHR